MEIHFNPISDTTKVVRNEGFLPALIISAIFVICHYAGVLKELPYWLCVWPLYLWFGYTILFRICYSAVLRAIVDANEFLEKIKKSFNIKDTE